MFDSIELKGTMTNDNQSSDLFSSLFFSKIGSTSGVHE